MQTTASRYCAHVAEMMATAHGGTPVEVTRRGREYVTTISTDELRRLETASAALAGFLRLAAREAECWEYSERAEDLVRLIRVGSVQLPRDLMDVIAETVTRDQAHDHDHGRDRAVQAQ